MSLTRHDTDDFGYQSALDLGAAIAAGNESAHSACEKLLSRIDAVDPTCRAFSVRLDERALERARALDAELARGDRRGPLHGVPVAVKDLCDVEGVSTGAGSPVLASRAPVAESSAVVERLEAAGAVVVGKLKMTEGAFVTHHPSVEPPVNPWRADRWTGISSSGSGVATAAGLAFLTLGSDTGGSIRFPSASCGVTGLKPTHGRVPLHGVFPLSASLDHVGPMARDVRDVAAAFQVLAGGDERCGWSLWDPVPDLGAVVRGEEGKIDHLRVGIDRAGMAEAAATDALARVLGAADDLAAAGARLEDAPFPAPIETVASWAVICAAEVAAAHEAIFPGREEQYGPELRQLIERGMAVTGIELARAVETREAFARRIVRLFDTVDVLLMPVYLTRAPAGLNPVSPDADPAMAIHVLRNSLWVDMARLPSLTLPCGLDDEGAPVGFQLVGPALSEPRLLELGAAYQRVTAWHLERPTSKD